MTLKESYMEAAKEIARADTDLSGKRECESGKWGYLSLPDLLIS